MTSFCCINQLFITTHWTVFSFFFFFFSFSFCSFCSFCSFSSFSSLFLFVSKKKSVKKRVTLVLSMTNDLREIWARQKKIVIRSSYSFLCFFLSFFSPFLLFLSRQHFGPASKHLSSSCVVWKKRNKWAFQLGCTHSTYNDITMSSRHFNRSS